MGSKVTVMNSCKQKGIHIVVWLCTWLPFIGVLWKDLLLQLFIGGSNPYVPSLWEGFGRFLPYLPLHVAVLWLLFGWSLLFGGRGRRIWNGTVGGVLTLICFIDIVYLRAYNVLPSVVMLPMLGTSTGQNTVSTILPTLLTWWDLLLLVDFIAWAVLLIVARRRGWLKESHRRPRALWVTLASSVLALVVLPLLSLCGVKEPFRRLYVTPDTLRQSQYFSFVGFHAADITAAATGNITTAVATPDDEAVLDAFRVWQQQDMGVSAHTGQFQGQNLLVIQFESLESFVLGNRIDGQEVTPTLNRLMSGSYAFTNLYEQVKSGNSADCDFLFMTGLLPTNKSYAFGSWAGNNYLSLPELLKENGGYESYYFHGAVNSIWNYTDMLEKGLGVDHIVMDYAQDDLLNGYLSDESFFRQTAKKLKNQPLGEPFYAHVVTCSSHIPCEVPADFKGLSLKEELAGNPMGDYLQAIHYTDRQIGLFLDELERDGTLENTLVVVIGDHGGIHKYYPHWVDDLSDEAREDWFLAEDEEYTLPMLVYSPAINDPHTVRTVGGQIDMLPTLLGLLGVKDERTHQVFFGRDLFATNRNFAVMDDGTLYGTLPEAELPVAQSMYYLSDLLIRSDRVSGEKEGA